jgi:hypothetical protein
MKTAWIAVVLLFVSGIWAVAQRSSLDYPLTLKTSWVYHFHQENGAGVSFSDDRAALAKGNVVDMTLVSVAAGLDQIGGREFTRVENRVNGKPWLFEWERVSPEGLLIGKTIDYQQGAQEVIMQPEQKRISTALQPGSAWQWQAKDAPVRFRYSVIGPDEVDVPAGHYHAVHLTTDGTVDAPFGKVRIRQETWFVPGVGIARQETVTSLQEHPLSTVVLTLEKIERPSQP